MQRQLPAGDRDIRKKGGRVGYDTMSGRVERKH